MIRRLFTSNKYLFIVTILLSILALPIIYNSTSFIRETYKLNSICVDINKINLSLNSSLNNGTLDVSSAQTLLNNGTIKLNSLSNKLSSIKVSSLNIPKKDKINEALCYNISLYNIASYLIQKPTSDDSNDKIIEFNKTLQLIQSSNINLTSIGLNPTFSDNNTLYFKATLNYINSAITTGYNKDIKAAQMKTFYNSLQDCLNLFDNIDEDLEPALYKIREDGRSFDVLLIDIKSKKNSLSTLKTKAANMSIPMDCSDIYKNLQDTINNFELYINSLQDSIIAEKDSSNASHKKDISSNYDNSFSRYKTFLTNLDKLKADLDIYNKNSI